jgi:hypothetical protein
MTMKVEHSVEWELAEETEVLGENLPQSHFVLHIKKTTRTKKAFSNFQVHIQARNEIPFVLHVFLFKKRFHIYFIF